VSELWSIITASDPELRNRSLNSFCSRASTAELTAEAEDLETHRHTSDSLYDRVRALFFLYAIHRFHLPLRPEISSSKTLIPYSGVERLLSRRYEEAISTFLAAQSAHGYSDGLSSALASAYRGLAFQTLADQVRRSVRSVRGNQWMFRTGHPSDYALRLRRELLPSASAAPAPILHESTPVRMDLSHSGWSDIFFLGMDLPEWARVLNISINLALHDSENPAPKPPVEAYLRVIDRPVIRLVSVDLDASVEIHQLQEMFDFGRDYLGLLKAAVIASGIVPAGLEGSDQPLSDLQYSRLGEEALAAGTVAVVTLAAGAGSRWTHGAGVVKGLSPFCRLAGKHRTFLEVHLAKSRRISRTFATQVPHVVTSSYLTHEPTSKLLKAERNYGYKGPLYLSRSRSVGLRLIPMVRDLRFAWEATPQQILDAQAQKVRDSSRAALISWAQQCGEGSDYTDNLPLQCLHPVGHWYEVPNIFRNGVLRTLLEAQPNLRYLMVHNVDTVGANLDPQILGRHISTGATMTVEVMTRRIEDRGGGLASVDGRMRLVEGLALPSEDTEFRLSYYNSNTCWLDIDALLRVFGLSRTDLHDEPKVSDAVRSMSARVPTYVTIKDVKKRWGEGQEDIFPVTQFEKLWVDMTALAQMNCDYVVVPRIRGQQLKEPAQLDGWLRDGSAEFVTTLCDFGD
jgi:hypothetical protein